MSYGQSEHRLAHAVLMGKSASPWVRSSGLGRLLAQETNVSDLIQFLSDRDASPWAGLVGFVPGQRFPRGTEGQQLGPIADLRFTNGRGRGETRTPDERGTAEEVRGAHLSPGPLLGCPGLGSSSAEEQHWAMEFPQSE